MIPLEMKNSKQLITSPKKIISVTNNEVSKIPANFTNRNCGKFQFPDKPKLVDLTCFFRKLEVLHRELNVNQLIYSQLY